MKHRRQNYKLITIHKKPQLKLLMPTHRKLRQRLPLKKLLSQILQSMFRSLLGNKLISLLRPIKKLKMLKLKPILLLLKLLRLLFKIMNLKLRLLPRKTLLIPLKLKLIIKLKKKKFKKQFLKIYKFIKPP